MDRVLWVLDILLFPLKIWILNILMVIGLFKGISAEETLNGLVDDDYGVCATRCYS